MDDGLGSPVDTERPAEGAPVVGGLAAMGGFGSRAPQAEEGVAEGPAVEDETAEVSLLGGGGRPKTF